MKNVFIRPIRSDEAEKFIDWARNNPENGFDPEVARYRNSITWVAYTEDGPLAYQTIQFPLMLESLAPKPGATEREIASALRELLQNAVTQAHMSGAGEIYFLGSSDATNEFAQKHLPVTEVPYRVFRCRLKDLQNEDNHQS